MAPSRTNGSIHTLQLGMSWFPEQAGNGLDRVYHALARHLPGVDVHFTGLVAGSPGTGIGSDEPVRAFASDAAPLIRRLLAIRKRVQREVDATEYDLIASHFALYTFPILDQLHGKPLVIHFHGPWAHEGRVEGAHALAVRLKAAVEQAVYRRGARFIVLSEAFGRLLQQHYAVPEERIRIIPGGVEVNQFTISCTRAEARARLGWPADRPIMLSVRRLARRMGLENLIEAMHVVRRRVPEAVLYIAGKGLLTAELAARVEAAGLGQQIKLLGYVPESDLPLAYRAADVTVVPSIALEGFGLVTVESLATGTPVLVTPVGGLPEAVRGLSRDLVLCGTRAENIGEHLSAAIMGDLKLPSATACQAYARAHFDWPVIAARTRTVYEELLP
ncbi:MAG TPA: glycosyltransferase family 4 protein [Rhodothermales bacterium]|nr:glycosyltransferase family 4 protein [Rhodothermales bacterium]